MAIPINIKELLGGNVVESTRIEFKTGFNPNPIVHGICAFANDIDNIGGGYLVIGVEEKDSAPQLPPKGVSREDIDGILKKLVELCHCIEPLYEPIVEPVLYDGVYVIVIWVPGGHGRPYKASKDVFANKADKRFYIRKFASTVIASPEEERELFYAASDIPFDDRPNLLASVDDLSPILMREHLKEIRSGLYELSANSSTLDIARDLRLVSGPPESLHPRNVGILMFSDCVNDYFDYARIEVVDIPEPTGRSISEKVFTGPIQRQLADALLYIKNYAIKELIRKDDDVAESNVVANYPFAAVEEILSNAVYHRSYQIHEPIEVRITPEGMEITSFPGFDRSITDADIANYDFHARTYRNRRIGDFLKELHLIEGRNTGFPRAIEALERNGSPLPRFRMDENRGYLSVTIPVHPDFLPASASRGVDYENRILLALGTQTLSLSELSRAMGYKSIPKRLKDAVESMVATGKLEKVPFGARTKFCAR